jgi:hypothetical protein
MMNDIDHMERLLKEKEEELQRLRNIIYQAKQVCGGMVFGTTLQMRLEKILKGEWDAPKPSQP